jgi:hypothetical protein
MAWFHDAINTEIERLFFLNLLKNMGISISRLNPLLNLHRIPIKHVVYMLPKSTHLEVSFELRCLQLFSLLYLATQRLPMAR